MKKLLIVDDDVVVLRALERTLRRQYEVRICASHGWAVVYANDWADVVLLDVDMPDRSGPELAKLFSPYLPVVFHTGNPGGVPRGARFVQKPARVEDIVAALEEAMR